MPQLKVRKKYSNQLNNVTDENKSIPNACATVEFEQKIKINIHRSCSYKDKAIYTYQQFALSEINPKSINITMRDEKFNQLIFFYLWDIFDETNFIKFFNLLFFIFIIWAGKAKQQQEKNFYNDNKSEKKVLRYLFLLFSNFSVRLCSQLNGRRNIAENQMKEKGKNTESIWYKSC